MKALRVRRRHSKHTHTGADAFNWKFFNEGSRRCGSIHPRLFANYFSYWNWLRLLAVCVSALRTEKMHFLSHCNTVGSSSSRLVAGRFWTLTASDTLQQPGNESSCFLCDYESRCFHSELNPWLNFVLSLLRYRRGAESLVSADFD